MAVPSSSWERKGREWGRVKVATLLVFISNCFLLKQQVPLALGELYWVVKKAIDHMWETGPRENKPSFRFSWAPAGVSWPRCEWKVDSALRRLTGQPGV